MRKRILIAEQKYQAAVEQLLQEMSRYPFDRLNKKPENGGWSAVQTAYHLILAEEVGLRYVEKKLSFGDDFEKAGWRASYRSFLLNLALVLPLRFKAPKATATENLPQQANFEEMEQRWKTIRASWQHFLEALPEPLLDKAVYKHPRVGKIGWLHLLSFLKLHLSRHQQQIRKALNNNAES